jgi:predicted secreted Zn-dependent protease
LGKRQCSCVKKLGSRGTRPSGSEVRESTRYASRSGNCVTFPYALPLPRTKNNHKIDRNEVMPYEIWVKPIKRKNENRKKTGKLK